MEYVGLHGVYADIPVDEIVLGWEKAYGRDRVRDWIKRFEEAAGGGLADFGKEEVLQE
jgi:predicted HAD superfamily phosphohydrolase YqeG